MVRWKKVERKRKGKEKEKKGWNGRKGASRPGLIKLGHTRHAAPR